MNFETMRYESDGDLIRLTLNRPEALNAVNLQGAVELHQAAQAIHDDETARAVIIRGKGRAFCAGIDLKELAAGETPHAYFYHWDRGAAAAGTVGQAGAVRDAGVCAGRRAATAAGL